MLQGSHNGCTVFPGPVIHTCACTPTQSGHAQDCLLLRWQRAAKETSHHEEHTLCEKPTQAAQIVGLRSIPVCVPWPFAAGMHTPPLTLDFKLGNTPVSLLVFAGGATVNPSLMRPALDVRDLLPVGLQVGRPLSAGPLHVAHA